ncbi:MAG: RsmG family class I SAM-dependent methyltransferase [Gaiellales bacterium]
MSAADPSFSDLRRALPDLSAETWRRLEAYGDLLAEPAIPHGLIGFPPERLPTELARTLLLAPLLEDADEVVDVGSGAGLPGIPLAIAGVASLVLIEPRRQALAFLERVIRDLDLPAVAIGSPAEALGRGPRRERAGAVVARALAGPAAAAELCAPLCRVGGKVVLTARLPPALPGLVLASLGLEDFRPIELEGCFDIRQRAHVAEKVSATDHRFPRRPGTAHRRPLG